MKVGGGGDENKRKKQRTIILDPDRRARPILADLIIPIPEDPRAQAVVKHRVVVVLLVAAVAVAAAVAEVVLERDVGGGRRGPAARPAAQGGDVVLGPVAVLEVDALGLAGVDVGVVPEGEGGVGGHGVVGVVFVADGGEAFVVVFAGAVVEGEDLGEGRGGVS